MYKTGGLEIAPDTESDILQVDGIDYVVSNKFKTLLRDSFVNWGTFLEIYKKSLPEGVLFEQVVKLLDVKDTENLRDMMVPLVKKIYHLPAEAHMACMLKQFMLYEPVSIALHAIFTTIRTHYEELVEQFIETRNKYIKEHKLKDKLNNLSELNKYWADVNNQHDLESSSLTLLFINPPKGLKNQINFKVKGAPSKPIETFRASLKKFKYPGFCPKVPQERIGQLLNFPIVELTIAIKSMDPDAKFPNYRKLEHDIQKLLAGVPQPPVIKDDIERKDPPKSLTEKIELIKWYVDEILALRKHLLPYGKAYEEYYFNHSKILLEINELIKKEFDKDT